MTQTAELNLETVFRALSDPTRLRILNLLRDGELCVCDLVNVLDVPQPTASRHLAYLRKAGLVLARKDGLWHYYCLTAATTPFHHKLLECVEAATEQVPQLAADTEQLRLGPCSDCCD
ncbi:MAG: winged helix-turn-helix transcriptional regulator [Planctomycetaceae bacterium]|nr:winged helix-turn-helix transcriptional regulator [Planctomycetaceae bacterium]